MQIRHTMRNSKYYRVIKGGRLYSKNLKRQKVFFKASTTELSTVHKIPAGFFQDFGRHHDVLYNGMEKSSMAGWILGTSDRLNDVDHVDIEFEDLFIIAINQKTFPGNIGIRKMLTGKVKN